jgi:hypothetical protein
MACAACIFLAANRYGSAQAEAPKPLPLTVAASSVGVFAKGYSWHLRVSPSGRAELTIDTYPAAVGRSFQVPEANLGELRRTLAAERFFSLASSYGESVADGSTETLSITLGPQHRTVRLRFLMNAVHQDQRSLLVEASRALRAWVLIRSWFDDPLAFDSRPYDQMVLEAAEQ